MSAPYEDVCLTDRNKLSIARAALEALKDAPLLQEERDAICRDALFLVQFGAYQAVTLGDWGKRMLASVTKPSTETGKGPLKGYLSIQYMQGFTQTDKSKYVNVRELAYLFDLWIQDHQSYPKALSVSSALKKAIDEEVGYQVTVVDTLIGEFILQVHSGEQKLVVHE